MISDVQTVKALQQQFNIQIITVSYPSYNDRLNMNRHRYNNLTTTYLTFKNNEILSEITNCENEQTMLLNKMNNMTMDQRACVKRKFFNNGPSHIYVKICGEWREIAYNKCGNRESILTKDGTSYTSFSDMGADLNERGVPIFLIQ